MGRIYFEIIFHNDQDYLKVKELSDKLGMSIHDLGKEALDRLLKSFGVEIMERMDVNTQKNPLKSIYSRKPERGVKHLK